MGKAENQIKTSLLFVEVGQRSSERGRMVVSAVWSHARLLDDETQWRVPIEADTGDAGAL
jgi:hypothetical protein